MKALPRFFLAACMLCAGLAAQAQVTANFSADSLIGCDQLSVNFTDLSTGPVSSWDWVIYNSVGTPVGTSILPDPSFLLTDPGTYDVELTVCDGAGGCDVLLLTAFLQLYESPDAVYVSSVSSGCPPLTVNFTDVTTYPSSSPVNRFWVITGGPPMPSTPSISYTFTTPGWYDVILVVEDDNGCEAFYADSIEVFAPPVVSIAATDSTSCGAPFTTTFGAAIAGTGPFTYFWDFGDGGSSTVSNPTHTYTSLGNYDVSVTITDANGCATTEMVPALIQIAPADVSFSTAAPGACLGTAVDFINTSTPSVGTWSWDFGDGTTDFDDDPSHLYATTGTYTVNLTGSFGSGCSDTYSMTLTVTDPPTVDFTSPTTVDCQVPSTIDFSSIVGAGIASYSWDFGDGFTSTLPNPSHTYTSLGDYTVTLTVTDVNGCDATVSYPAYVKLRALDVGFVRDPSEGCVPLMVEFTDTTTAPPFDPVVSWSWDFGDGGTSTAGGVVSNTYTNAMCYNVTLTASTAAGCSGTRTTVDAVCVGDTGTAVFTVPDTSCPAVSVIVGTPGLEFLEVLVDGAAFTGIAFPTPTTIIPGLPPGTHTLDLISYDYGCTDTFSTSIEILEPVDSVVTLIQDCDDPYTVTLILSPWVADSATSWAWDMADGTVILNEDTVVYTYDTTGYYPIDFSATGIDLGVCGTLASGGIYILDPVADFEPSIDNSCSIPVSIIFNNLSSDGYTSLLTTDWIFGDGATAFVPSPTRNFTSYGEFFAELTITDLNGCTDTHLDTVYISNVEAELDWSFLCEALQIEFIDSTESVGAVTEWSIDYGDGTSEVITPPDSLGTIIHTYPFEGEFDVTLFVENEFGCQDSLAIEVENIFLNADFTVSDTLPCTGDTISFLNTSVGAGLVYSWDFGDPSTLADTSNATSPSYSYGDLGTYTPSLIVTDLNGCSDTLIRPALVETDSMVVDSFTWTALVESCNFALVEFFPNPADTLDACSYFWSFGDGGTSTEQSPVYPFVLAGEFSVSLTITNCNGCSDTRVIDRAIDVIGPYGTYEVLDDSVCIGTDVMFAINFARADSIFFFAGNGDVDRYDVANTDTLLPFVFSYNYGLPGAYFPQIVLSDTGDCATVVTTDSIWVGEPPSAEAGVVEDELCEGLEFQFFDLTTLTDQADIIWQFPDGDLISAPGDTVNYQFSAPGSYTIPLIVETVFGCEDSASVDVVVLELPALNMTPDTTTCPGLSVQLEANGGLSYNWTPAGDLDDPNSASPTATPSVPTTYQVVVDNGFCIDSGTVFVDFLTELIEDWGSDTLICIGGSVPLFVDFYDNVPDAVLWNWDPAGDLDDPFSVNPVATPGSTGMFNYVINASCGTLVNSESVAVTVNSPPTAFVAQGDTTIFPGAEVLLPAGATGGIAPLSYNWSPAASLSCVDCASTVASPTQTTTYQVSVSDSKGCSDTATVRIYVRDECGGGVFEIPNLMTPNGDGANDRFTFRYEGVSEIKAIRIYNRWGELIFEGNDVNQGWDGTYKGQLVNAGVYVYTIEAVCDNQQAALLTGNVTLLR